jgi:serine/threonine protein kinase
VAEWFGHYRLDELIGRGDAGEVFRAFDTVKERSVALKLLPAGFTADARFQERFRRESELVARLADPHILPIHDYGELDGRLFVDMPLVAGRDLAGVLDEAGPATADIAVDLASQVAQALDTSHRAGLVHGAVKPSNVLVTESGAGYLTDFGIVGLAGSGVASRTGNGPAVGTFAYMAPERFAGGPADQRIDVYSLACLLFELLTGEKPFPGEGLPVMRDAHLNLPPPRPSAHDPALPSALDEVIARGMAKEPQHRYPTAGALAADARAALSAPVAPAGDTRAHPVAPGTRQTQVPPLRPAPPPPTGQAPQPGQAFHPGPAPQPGQLPQLPQQLPPPGAMRPPQQPGPQQPGPQQPGPQRPQRPQQGPPAQVQGPPTQVQGPPTQLQPNRVPPGQVPPPPPGQGPAGQGPPAGPPSRRATWIGIAAGVAVALGLLYLGFLWLGPSKPEPGPGSPPIAEPTPAPSGCEYPGQVLDLRNWLLNTPVMNAKGDPEEIKQPRLNDFTSPPWFQVGDGCQGVRFRASVAAVTTDNSSYPRSELREMTPSGDTAGWSSDSGTHTMTVVEAFTALPKGKPHVVGAQIHDEDDDVSVLRLEGTNLYFTKGDDTHFKLITDDYQLGTRIEVKYVVSNNTVQAYYNGQLQTSFIKNFSDAYFKAGAYVQANCKKDNVPCDLDNYGETTVYSVQVQHS